MTHHWGYVGAVVSALLFGVGTTLNKIALADVHPTVMAGLIYFFAGITLSIARFSPVRKYVMIVLKTPTKTEPKICRKDIGVLGLVVLSGSMTAPFLFLNGLNQTTAINASFLQNAEFFFTIVIAVFFLKEQCNRRELTGIAFLLIGAIFWPPTLSFTHYPWTNGFSAIFSY
jgi:drug/metabolite transporter (DMT)-like permease